LVIGLFSNKWILFGVSVMIVLQISFTYLPVMNRFFHSAPINSSSWIWILAFGLLVYSSVSLEKRIRLAIEKSADQ
ncbi:MAG: cation transporting ATPase C-terminal domain-containing protein, partial [Candidatus Omnitrophica bacterium]|nr:cation transporting ATPase C-terminal domain-containing protein [Candidatus Omnitrophota bacterium]